MIQKYRWRSIASFSKKYDGYVIWVAGSGPSMGMIFLVVIMFTLQPAISHNNNIRMSTAVTAGSHNFPSSNGSSMNDTISSSSEAINNHDIQNNSDKRHDHPRRCWNSNLMSWRRFGFANDRKRTSNMSWNGNISTPSVSGHGDDLLNDDSKRITTVSAATTTTTTTASNHGNNIISCHVGDELENIGNNNANYDPFLPHGHDKDHFLFHGIRRSFKTSGYFSCTPRIQSNIALSSYNTRLSNTLQRQLEKRMEMGRITCDFGTRQSQMFKRSQSLLLLSKDHVNTDMSHNIDPATSISPSRKVGGKIRISVDAQGLGRLLPILLLSCTTFLSAFMATLRLLAPLVISKRILCSMGNLISDWYTGRYFRKTYSRLEKIYIHYYETPATFRALSRTISQWCIYLLLGKFMGYLVGITHKPCRSEGRGLALTCGLLWVGSVVGTGHAFAEAVARWGGPLRLQAVKHVPKKKLMEVFTRPWHILHWMQNPEQWIDMIAEPERRPFDPNPILFPVTWIPLRLLQMVAVAKVVCTDPEEYVWCPVEEGDQVPKILGKFLLQLALGDEWYRVFIREKRVGLGIAVMILYYLSMLSLLVSSAMLNGSATLLMVPSLVAVIVSGWMNIVIFWNRYETKRQRERSKISTPGTVVWNTNPPMS